MLSLFRRNKVTVGLDVGSGFVKAAVIDHSGAEPELTQLAHLPLVSDAIVEGEIMDPTMVVETIQGVIANLGVPAKSVVTAVGGRDVIVKKIQMDRMPESDAREVIRWEAEQYVPFDMANVQLDFQILDPFDDGLQMSVLLVAAKRELVDQKLALLRDAGLTVGVVDVDAFALHNAFEFNYPHAMQGVNALVNVGNEASSVIVQQEGVPVVTRDIPFGTRHLREELRRTLGLSSDQAEALLQGHPGRVEDAASLLRDRSEELAIGVERAVALYGTDAAAGQGLSALYLAGGGARIPHLAETLSQRLRVRVEVANPLERLRVHPQAASQLSPDGAASMWMLPVGLALRFAA